jgi:hypothetical protein
MTPKSQPKAPKKTSPITVRRTPGGIAVEFNGNDIPAPEHVRRILMRPSVN